MTSSMFHDGHCALQDKFDRRRVADAPEKNRRLATFSPERVTMIEEAAFFVVATAPGDFGRVRAGFRPARDGPSD